MNVFRRWFTKGNLFSVVQVFAALYVVWYFAVFFIDVYRAQHRLAIIARAASEARNDIEQGEYKIQMIGGPPAAFDYEYVRLLRDRYGVKINVLASCVVPNEIEWYHDGYNCVSEPRIREHFGKDIFAECYVEAKTLWLMEVWTKDLVGVYLQVLRHR
jgi:hypothetical protein